MIEFGKGCHNVIPYPKFENVMLKLLPYDIAQQLIRSSSTNNALNMESSSAIITNITNQQNLQFLELKNPFSLENDDFQTQHPNRIPLELEKEAYHLHFDDIFSAEFPPNISTLSISTKSNKSYENLDISQEFFSGDYSRNPLYLQPLDYGLGDAPESQYGNDGAQFEEEEKYILQIPTAKLQEEKVSEEPENTHDQTKNIPKNYIKAIFTFILENTDYIQSMFARANLGSSSVSQFLEYVKTEKKTKRYTIQRLKSLWLHPQNGKAMRIISFEFLRKRSLGYILSSKIEKKMPHIKHRFKFLKAVANPSEFTNIK